MRRVFLGLSAFFLLVTAIYAAAAWNNEFVYDDRLLVLEQAPPQSMTEVFAVFGKRHWSDLPYYRPIPRLTMVAQKYFHGNVVGPYHLFNAALIGMTAWLVYALFRIPALRVDRVYAWLGAGLFVLHPIASSTVHPISAGRDALLPAMLMIATVYCYLRPGVAWRVLSIAGLALSLLSKEQAVVLPVLFVAADGIRIAPRPARSGAAGWIARYLPVALVLVGYLVVRWSLFGGGSEHELTVLDRPLGPLLSLLYALQSIFFPFVQLVYEPRFEIWLSAWRSILSAVVLAAIGFGIWRATTDACRSSVFWLAWFLIGALPTANIFLQQTEFAERYVFFSSLGAIGTLAVLGSDHCGRG